MVGTTKGAFLLKSNSQRTKWEVGGPYFHGYSVYSLAYDDRAGRHRIWASTHSYWGTLLRSTDDFGRSWTTPQEATIRFPVDTGLSLQNIWQITLGPQDEPDVLYCGVEPAALFETRDEGETWSLVRGLFDHPHRPRWMPGNGGLALHTIVLDPNDKQRRYVAISAGGVYRTEDGGCNWTAQNRGIRAVTMPNKYPEFGQCIHKVALHPARPERLFLQSHWGLYRSDDHAENWKDIANGVPSDFGFAMIMHPRNPDCVYIVPVESDEFRCTCDGRLRVYRTRNAGNSWEPLMRGLPQKGAYETVLREGLAADSLDPLGLYLGNPAAANCSVRAMREKRGIGFWKGCPRCSASAQHRLRTHRSVQSRLRGNCPLRLHLAERKLQPPTSPAELRGNRASDVSHTGRPA